MMYKPPQINWGQMGQVGQNVGQGMQGGQDAMRQRMMQQYLGPQSQAGWALGTRTTPAQPMSPDLWSQLRGMYGR